MAAVSYSIKLGDPAESIVAATNAPSAGVLEIRMDQTSTTVTDGTGTRAPRRGELQTLLRVIEQKLMTDINLID